MRLLYPGYQYKDLPETGFHEVVSHGRLMPALGRRQYQIEVGLRERLANPADPKRPLAEYVSQRPWTLVVGVADLVAFPIGRIFRGREPIADIVLDPALRCRDHFKVDLEDVVPDTPDAVQPFDTGIPDGHLAPESLIDRHILCTVLYSRKTGQRIFVPCSELVRKIFGASSEMLKAVVHGNLGTHSTRRLAIFNKDRSHWDSGTQAQVYVHAHRKLTASEARLAGRLVADDPLWEFSRSIWGRARVDNIEKHPVHLKAYLPDRPIPRVRLLCQDLVFEPPSGVQPDPGNLVSGQVRRTMVARILEIDVPNPVKRLVVGVPSKAFDPERPGGPRYKPMTVDPPSLTSLNHADEPGHAGASPFDLPDPKMESVASNSNPIKIEEVQYIIGSSGDKLQQLGPTAASSNGSTSDPSYGKQRVSHVNLVDTGADLSLLHNPPADRGLSRRLVVAAEALLIASQQRALLAAEITASGQHPLTGCPSCILFPVEYRDDELTWSYIDQDADIRRRALVVCLASASCRYLIIEIEVERDPIRPPNGVGNENDSARLLVLRMPHDAEITPRFLNLLLVALAKKHGCWKRVGELPGSFVLARHHAGNAEAEGMAQTIEDALDELGFR
ncbi:hypothetical protein [Azospirillum sp. sgz302134]